MSHRDQAAILLDFAARLRREGAGAGGLRAALQERLAAIPAPVVTNAELEGIASGMAEIQPSAVVRAVNRLLRNKLPGGLPLILPLPLRERAGVRGQSPLLLPVGGPPKGEEVIVHTAMTISAGIPAAVDWVIEPWAAAGALTAITGRPKIGKTTFVLDLVASVLTGGPSLGSPSHVTPSHAGKGPGDRSSSLPSPLEGEGPGMRERGQGITSRAVLYLTEQQPSSFRASLARSGLLDQDGLAVIFWHEAMALSWPAIVALAGDQCRARGARLLVVDTLSQWVGLRGDMENQAGDAYEALQPLQALAARGIAVVFVQHERKGGGDAADAGRGSSAFAGAVDTLISFRRPPYVSTSPAGKGSGVRSHPSPIEGEGPGMRGEGNGSEVRLLLALSRFDAVPPELYIERRDGSYTVLGDAAGFAAGHARASILGALQAPGSGAEGPSLTVEELIQAAGTRRTTALKLLEELVAAGRIARVGDGRRGSPYRYRRQECFLSPL